MKSLCAILALVGTFVLCVTALLLPLQRHLAQVVVAPASSVAPSAWDEPQLVNPITITLDDQHRNLALPQNQDYILKCAGPVQATWGFVVWGGHNVVLDGCDYVNSSTSGAAEFKNQMGTLWLHDDHFAGPQQTEGIDLQEPGTTTVVMRDVLIDPITGSFQTNHADCLQSWSGPQRLLIDGFTCTSQYQGFFLLPNQQDSATQETVWDFRHVNLHLNPGGYAWTFGTNGPEHVDLNVDHFYVDGPGQPLLYKGGEGGENILAGSPPGGDYVTATAAGASGVDDLPVDPLPVGEN